MYIYSIRTTTDRKSLDENDQEIILPIGTEINTVLWDGVSEWAPPNGTEAVKIGAWIAPSETST